MTIVVESIQHLNEQTLGDRKAANALALTRDGAGPPGGGKVL